jgi:hypothetical protein
VPGASENVFSAHTVRSAGKLKAIRSVNTRSSESVSATSSTITEASFCCALFCVLMTHLRYNFGQRVFIYHCYVKKELVQTMQEKISPKISRPNMSVWRYNFQISEESSSPWHLIDRKPLKGVCILTNDISCRLEHSPLKSLRRLALQSDLENRVYGRRDPPR